ncbi:MAG: flavodoxin family protein [Nitrospirae bacterium]|nr:MAG: flavodoxin family protein [Nitrospirota bacterium]
MNVGVPFPREGKRRVFILLVWLIGAGWVASLGMAAEPVSVRVLVVYHSLTGNTEKLAHAVAEGAQSVPGTTVDLRRVGEVTAEQLFTADAVIVGSPVYWSNMAGEVKTFFDNWQFRFGVYPEFKMRNKVGAAFATGGQVSSGKEVTLLTILAAMLGNQMIVVSGGGAFGASATTEGQSPGIDEMELQEARSLGQRVAQVTHMVKLGQQQMEKAESRTCCEHP